MLYIVRNKETPGQLSILSHIQGRKDCIFIPLFRAVIADLSLIKSFADLCRRSPLEHNVLIVSSTILSFQIGHEHPLELSRS